MGDNSSIPVQRKRPVSATEHPDEGLWALDAGTRNAIQGYLSIMIPVAIFGSSTFFSLTSQLAESTKFSLGTVRTFLATSFLLFILTFTFALGAIMLIGPYVALSKAMERPGQYSKLWTNAGMILIILMHFSCLGAFLFMSLVVMAYAETVGWVLMGINVVATVFGIFLWSFILIQAYSTKTAKK